MENFKQLKGRSYKTISIQNDPTKAQREEFQNFISDANARQEAESGDWVFQVVGYLSN